jgi:hypothetical protein
MENFEAKNFASRLNFTNLRPFLISGLSASEL